MSSSLIPSRLVHNGRALTRKGVDRRTGLCCFVDHENAVHRVVLGRVRAVAAHGGATLVEVPELPGLGPVRIDRSALDGQTVEPGDEVVLFADELAFVGNRLTCQKAVVPPVVGF